jgi:hypothetical protein
MKIFHAIGFGIFLIILRIVMPDVFQGLESVLVKLFQVLQEVLGHFPDLSGQTASALPHAILPR